eukprot:m.174901 g.174901  ORF g.174901 m.174901 type:complete len:373 (-) comp18341_c0_seq1:79-1197(-)
MREIFNMCRSHFVFILVACCGSRIMHTAYAQCAQSLDELLAKNDAGPRFVYFKHIRKSGGTSMRLLLRKAIGHALGFDAFSGTLSDPQKPSRGNSTRLQLLEEEFGTTSAECILSYHKKCWCRQTISILVIRNPVERWISDYFYCRKSGRFSNQMLRLISSKQLHLISTITRVRASKEVLEWMEAPNPTYGTKILDERGAYMSNYMTKLLTGRLLQDPKARDDGSCGAEETTCQFHRKMSAFNHTLTPARAAQALQVLNHFTFVAPFEAMGEDTFATCLADVLSLPMDHMIHRRPGQGSNRETTKVTHDPYVEFFNLLTRQVQIKMLEENSMDLALHAFATTAFTNKCVSKWQPLQDSNVVVPTTGVATEAV